MSVTTAILLFAQPVASDATGKSLFPSTGVNRRLHWLLNGRVRQTVGQTGLPVLQSTELITHTGSFGAQLTAAVRAVFARGYEQVLVVGNDCPALTRDDLLTAVEQVRAGRVVLGPDQRGGVYLLGLSRTQFNATTFSQLPWQTARLLESFQAAFAKYPTATLRPLGDINTQHDLRAYPLHNITPGAFMARLFSLLTSPAERSYAHHIGSDSGPDVYRTGPLRAPPSSFSLR